MVCKTWIWRYSKKTDFAQSYKGQEIEGSHDHRHPDWTRHIEIGVENQYRYKFYINKNE